MKVLVTGGTGFIGSHLVEVLLQRGDHVRCLLRKPDALKWLKGLPIEIVQGDCTNKGSLKEAVKGVDQVLHLAGVTKAVKEETYFQVNAYGTENLVQACLEHNPDLQKFIYLSSQAAAGPSDQGCCRKESDLCEPVSPYGRSKRMGEELALGYCHRLPLLILRPSAVYGPRDRDIFTYFKLLSKRVMPCLAGETHRISLCYVHDVVRALLLAGDAKAESGEVFFLTDGRDYPMEVVGETFAQALGIRAYCIYIPKWMILKIASFSEYMAQISGKPCLISKGKAAEMTQKNWVCDATKAAVVLGFTPQIDLARGARLTVDWYRKANWL